MFNQHVQKQKSSGSVFDKARKQQYGKLFFFSPARRYDGMGLVRVFRCAGSCMCVFVPALSINDS